MGEARRFHLQKRLGAGAFGEVFLAEQDSGAGFRKRVAIKLLHPHHTGLREAARRMRDEARILGRLSHRNIVTVLDLTQLDDRWAVIMDYIPGVDLDRILEAMEQTDGAFWPAPAVLEVGADIAAALDAAYHTLDTDGRALNVVHRDIKPSNVLITPDGDVKVLDFGVARVSNLDGREAKTTRGLIGTERYMSPERICGEGDLPAGDVYALMASLVELLLLRPLGRTPVLPDRHAAFVEEAIAEARPLLCGPDEVVEEIVELFRAGLHDDPDKRPTAAVITERFEALSRQVLGDSLRTFANAWVPRIQATLEPMAEPVDGVLTARTATPSGGSAATISTDDLVSPGDPGSSQTILPPSQGAEYEEDGATTSERTGGAVFFPRNARARLGIGIIIGIVLLFGLTGGAVAASILFVNRGGTDTAVQPVAPGSQVTASVQVEDEEPEFGTVHVPAEGTEDSEAADPDPSRTPAPQPRPFRPAPRPTPSEGTADGGGAEPEVEPEAVRVPKALFVLRDASTLEVTCGDVVRTGTASVRMRDFPAGECVVVATYLGRRITGTTSLDRPAEVQCGVVGDRISCR